MKNLTFLLLCIILIHQPVMAISLPKASSYDARIRTVTYNPQDVVQIEAVIGIATHIVLEEGEEYLTHAFGDADAWNFAYQLNHYFVKSAAEVADTNLTIVTNKRTYYFRLNYHPTREARAMYGVKFSYPDTELQLAEKSSLEQKFRERGIKYNLAYTMSGDLDLAPVNTWDNGQFTYFKFASNVDIAGIYFVDASGRESIANRLTAGSANDIIVVHKVSPRWVLRLGNRALAVYNEAYTKEGSDNTSGTAAAVVKRIINH